MVRIVLNDVIDTRSGHRGQVNKGHNINLTILGSCDSCLVVILYYQQLSVILLVPQHLIFDNLKGNDK